MMICTTTSMERSYSPTDCRNGGHFEPKIASQTLFRSRDFRTAIERAIAEHSPDIIQAHDMFVAGSALAARPPIPVVLDLHEHYPAATEVYRTAYPTVKRALFGAFQHRRRMERIETRYINKSALTLTVTEEATERVLGKCPGALVTTVPNLESRISVQVSPLRVTDSAGERRIPVGPMSAASRTTVGSTLSFERSR